MSSPPRARRAGRPPVIRGGAIRYWLYVNRDRRDAAADRAERDGTNLPTVMRAFLDAYAAGKIDAPEVTP